MTTLETRTVSKLNQSVDVLEKKKEAIAKKKQQVQDRLAQLNTEEASVQLSIDKIKGIIDDIVPSKKEELVVDDSIINPEELPITEDGSLFSNFNL